MYLVDMSLGVKEHETVFGVATPERQLDATEVVLAVNPETLAAMGRISGDFPEIVLSALEKEDLVDDPTDTLEYLVGIDGYKGYIGKFACRMFNPDSSEFPIIISSLARDDERLECIGEFLTVLNEEINHENQSVLPPAEQMPVAA